MKGISEVHSHLKFYTGRTLRNVVINLGIPQTPVRLQELWSWQEFFEKQNLVSSPILRESKNPNKQVFHRPQIRTAIHNRGRNAFSIAVRHFLLSLSFQVFFRSFLLSFFLSFSLSCSFYLSPSAPSLFLLLFLKMPYLLMLVIINLRVKVENS